MKIIRNNSSIDKESYLVATIGYFDGIHLGHKEIIKRIVNDAKSNEGESILITFWPHPRTILNKNINIKFILSKDDKHKLLNDMGIDILYIIKFTVNFSKISASEFINQFLIKKLNIDKLIIGYNHCFGHNREGNFRFLKKNKEKYPFKIEEVKKKEIDKKLEISSSEIRNKILNGEMKDASIMLGYRYFLEGNIISGDGIGKGINFPTANIKIDNSDKIIPKDGVYVAQAIIGNERYNGMVNIGYRPTVDGNSKTIEMHMFDFDDDLYGEVIQIIFIKRIRNEIKFDNLNELESKLNQDKKTAIKIIRDEKIRN